MSAARRVARDEAKSGGLTTGKNRRPTDTRDFVGKDAYDNLSGFVI